MKMKANLVNMNAEKGKLKQKFAGLTNDDLLFEEGKKEELTGRFNASLFQTREQLKRNFDKK